jgi:hypothetical protein
MNSIFRLTAAFALMIASVTLAASAADKRETRPVSGFTGISLAAPLKLQFTQGDTEGLVLEGDEAALAELVTVVKNGTLDIRTRSRAYPSSLGKVKAFVTAKTLEKLSIAGSGDIAGPILRSERLRVAISGSGDVRIGTLASGTVDVSVSGSGNVTLGGKAESVTTSIAGSGDAQLAKLEARRAKVSIAGSGDATFWAKDALEVSIVGSGDVRYYGDPALTTSVIGAGTVKRAGATPS